MDDTATVPEAQTVAVDRPAELQKLPAGQGVHTVRPVVFANEPAGQLVQVPEPVAEYLPNAHNCAAASCALAHHRRNRSSQPRPLNDF